MMTVKEISKITGITIRTLHYYDQIGLFKPTDKSEAGYRLYDDNALKQLQQILFFREFDIPLKEIKSVMENPALDSNYILQMQRNMLIAKKERIERLINRIDDILKGEDKMDFEVFNKKEIEELFSIMVRNCMPDELRETAAQEFGGMEQWKEHYIETVSGENVQKCYLKMVEWFGGKEKYVSSVKNPVSKEIAESYLKRIDVILKKLFDRRDFEINSFEVKEVVGEYGFVTKQLYQLKDETGMMLSLAQSYRNDDVMSIDEKYGEGASEFFAQAIENFYK